MYKLKDEFTSRDGNLDPNGDSREYGITKEIMDKYGPELKGEGVSEEKGCATCIYVKLEGGPSDTVFAFTSGGHTEEAKVEQDRWAHVSMFNPGSGYNPDNIAGPWSVHAKDAPSDIASGIGLPYGWHVSTFKVLTWDETAVPGEEGTGEGPEVPVEPVGLDKYPLFLTFSIGTTAYEGYVRKVKDE